MPRVNASIQDYPTHLIIIFYVGNQKIGPTVRCADEEAVFRVLRRAHANLETLNVVEMSLAQRRPCNVELTLTDEQYRKLSNATGRPATGKTASR
jgi:hypothetical protein